MDGNPPRREATPLLTRFGLLDIILPGVALAGVLAGFHLRQPPLLSLGVLVLGGRFVLAGWLALRERQIIVWNPNYRRFTDAVRVYHGPAAAPMGLAGMLLGAVLAVLAVTSLAGVSVDALRAALVRRPALMLVPTGLIVCLYGLGFLLGFQDHGEDIKTSRTGLFLLHLPERLGGAILVLLGAGLLLVAAYGEARRAGFAGPAPEVYGGEVSRGLAPFPRTGAILLAGSTSRDWVRRFPFGEST